MNGLENSIAVVVVRVVKSRQAARSGIGPRIKRQRIVGCCLPELQTAILDVIEEKCLFRCSVVNVWDVEWSAKISAKQVVVQFGARLIISFRKIIVGVEIGIAHELPQCPVEFACSTLD